MFLFTETLTHFMLQFSPIHERYILFFPHRSIIILYGFSLKTTTVSHVCTNNFLTEKRGTFIHTLMHLFLQ